MDWGVTPAMQVTSPTWGPPPPCKQALIILVTRFMEEMSYMFSFTFFPAAHFHLALVAASISHFVSAATKLPCCSFNKKNVSFVFYLSL